MKIKTLIFLLTCILLFYQSNAQQIENVQIARYHGIPAQAKINDILVDDNEVKWVATSKGLFRLTSFAENPKKIESINEAYALAESTKGQIWVGTDNGIVQNVYSDQVLKIPGAGVNITSLCLIKSQIWVGTDNGIYIFNNRNGNLLHHHNAKNSKLASNQIRFIEKDNRSQLWIGADKGIVRVINDKWKVWDKGLSQQAIDYNVEGVWLINEKKVHLIDKDNSNSWYPVAKTSDMGQGDIREMTIDSKGNLYIASELLIRFNPYTENVQEYGQEIGFISNQCLSISADKKDNIWVGTADSGLYRLRFSDEEDARFDELNAVLFVEKSVPCYQSKGAEISAFVTGGIPPYKYAWNSSSTNKPRISDLPAGFYAITVTDSINNEFLANIELDQPDPIVVSIEETTRISAAGRSDGTARISIKGGTKPYSTIWNNKAIGTELSTLSPGSYAVTVTDANGCTGETRLSIDKEKFIPELDVANLQVGQTLRINQLYFDADSSLITSDSYPVLDEIFEFLISNSKIAIEIGGHTNGIPPHDYCDKLSTSRAENVALYLWDKGISQGRIAFKGYGKRQPIATNRSVAGRQKNQRVEIKILKVD